MSFGKGLMSKSVKVMQAGQVFNRQLSGFIKLGKNSVGNTGKITPKKAEMLPHCYTINEIMLKMVLRPTHKVLSKIFLSFP